MFDFDFSNGYVVLRIVCGAFMLPNAYMKLRNPQGSVGFFQKARYPMPMAFVVLATAFEFVAGTALVLGVYTAIAAWLTAAFMLVATVSDLKVNKAWMWTKGGCEYPLFWSICAAVVAANS